MANELDEVNGPINEAGRGTNVIDKQIPITVGVGSKIFEVLLWVLGIIPGLIFLIMKIKAKNYLRGLEQKIQANASTIDNYLQQKVVILTDAIKIADKAVDLDKDVMKSVAAYRSGGSPLSDAQRNELSGNLDRISVAFEAYPDLKSHAALASLMQQNSYAQKEITAARELYNSSVLRWNQDVRTWPTKQIVAAKLGYTTRVPFIASAEMKRRAEESLIK